MNKIEKAFGNIKADDALKEATFEKVAAQMRTQPEKSKVVKQRRNARRFAAVAAVLVVALVFAGGGYHAYAKPVSYITMNVNPSVELGINRWDKVVECTGLNDDGSELLDRVDVKGLNYKNAMEELCRTNGRLKKRELSRREFIFGFNRIAASLLLMLVIGGACVGTYLIAEHGLPGAGRDGSAETAEATEAPEEAQSTGAAEDTKAEEETAAESTGDAGSAAAADAAAQVDPEEAAFAGGTVRLADEQELPAGTGEIRTLVSSPVLDREAESVKITIGNLSEETITYRTDIELQVYLDGAWYVVPGTEEGAAAQEPRTVELEAGMAQDEEILLSGYTLDFEAEKYRAAVNVDGSFFGAEFRFETLEEGLEEALEGTLEGNPDDAGQQALQ